MKHSRVYYHDHYPFSNLATIQQQIKTSNYGNWLYIQSTNTTHPASTLLLCLIFRISKRRERHPTIEDTDNKLHGGRASGTCCLKCRKAVCVLNVNRLVRHSGCPVMLSLDSRKELAVKAVSLMYFLSTSGAWYELSFSLLAIRQANTINHLFFLLFFCYSGRKTLRELKIAVIFYWLF